MEPQEAQQAGSPDTFRIQADMTTAHSSSQHLLLLLQGAQSDTAKAMEAEAAFGADQAALGNRAPLPEPQAMAAEQAAAVAEDVLPNQRSKKLAKVCVSCRLS